MTIFSFTRMRYLLICTLMGARLVLAQSFVNPIPVPPVLQGKTFDLVVDTAMHNFNPNQAGDSLNGKVPAFCFNIKGTKTMSYLGPTMIWEKGQPLAINITNRLNQRMTSHWHGLNLPSAMDGGPQEPINANGGVWSPRFTNIDPVQTAWYHSHLMDSTTTQVIMGLAGMVILEDPTKDPLRALLPHNYGTNDFPIVIQEKGFNFQNHKVQSMIAGAKPGNGPYTLVNGVVNGVLRVPPQQVRLRFLNGSPRKSFQVGISKSLTNQAPVVFNPLQLIATDGGYVAQPMRFDSFLISPGERMEMVFDFTGMSNGETLYLRNLVRSIPSDIVTGGGGPPPQRDTPGAAFMAFVVDNTIQPANPIFQLPATLKPYTVDTSNIFKRRTKKLYGASSSGGVWTIDSLPMDMDHINDFVHVNKKEMWTIQNMTNIAHPFHIHKVQFQVVQYIDRSGSTPVVMNFPNLPRHLMGYKDDALVRAKSTMTFIAKFDSFPSTGNVIDGFMYHCHILSHEDTSMMHQFAVVDSASYYTLTNTGTSADPKDRFTFYPNPASDMLYIKGSAHHSGTLRFIDLMGRVLREERIGAFHYGTSVEVGDLPRGLVFVEWSSGRERFAQKVWLRD